MKNATALVPIAINMIGLEPTANNTPIYFPKKHTVMSWAAQRRAAKKRRRSNAIKSLGKRK